MSFQVSSSTSAKQVTAWFVIFILQELELTRVRLSAEVEERSQLLSHIITDAESLTKVLDQTAKTFRQAHNERQDFITQWESSVQILHQRNRDIHSKVKVWTSNIDYVFWDVTPGGMLHNTITRIELLFSCLSQVLVPIYRNKCYHIPEDHTLDTDLHKNLQSHVVFIMRVTKFWFAPSSTMLHCVTPHLLYCSARLHTAQNCFTPCCTALHQIALYCTALHCCISLLMSGNCSASHRSALLHRWDSVLVCAEDYRTEYKVWYCVSGCLSFWNWKTTLQINIQQKSCSLLHTAEWNHSDQHMDHKDNCNYNLKPGYG